MKPGDIVFFKKAKSSSGKRAAEYGFKGHAFGVLLGIVPPFQRDPPIEMVMRFMGQAGFLTFDDIVDFFGKEIGEECVKKFTDKYYGPEATKDLEEKLGPISVETPVPPKPSGLVDASGREIN